MWVCPVGVQLRLREGETLLSIGHWQGLKPLHHWKQRLYQRRGGQCLSFRDTSVRLDETDLTALEKAIVWAGSAPFWDLNLQKPLDDDEMMSIKHFVKAARPSIEEEHTVIDASFK